MSDEFSLDDIFNALPDVKVGSRRTPEVEKAREGFQQVLDFFEKHHRIPSAQGDTDLQEKSLAARLARIKSVKIMLDAVKDMDTFGILDDGQPSQQEDLSLEAATDPVPVEEPEKEDLILASADDPALIDVPESLDDIFASMEVDEDSIFNLKHVRSFGEKKIVEPDFVSQREPCPDFDKYKLLFDEVSQQIKNGIREPLPFANEQEISQGQFFILNGVLLYIAEVGEEFERNGKKNARLKVIFNNGTLGNNLKRSIATELYKDVNGRRISDPKIGGLFSGTADLEDIGTGTIYVLRSLSEHPQIKKDNKLLHKIGVTKGNVKARISGAEKDPTYLRAPVQVVATFKVFNTKPHHVEKLLHTYFEAARANISLKTMFGDTVKSKEWFFLPLPTIKEAVKKLVDGELLDTYFDAESATIKPKHKKT
ncbi:MAG: GIY-YIG nuclease family protein [Rhodobacteraceae bacterium]|nr:GIY-YIG nuclease family protein [Paracoccaceae bacterium]